MKKSYNIIIIDDTDQSNVVAALELKLKEVCDLNIITIKTSDAKFKKDDSEDLDPEKLRVHLINVFTGKSIKWVFTDLNLAEEHYDGIDVVKELIKIRPKVEIILYSGNRDEAIRKLLGKKAKDASEEDIIDVIKQFKDFPIIDFVNRNDYSNKLEVLVRKDDLPTIEEIFVDALREHSEMEFKSCYPPFTGMKLGEIADIIEGQSDERSREWILELIKQAMSYLIKINE